MKKLMLAVGIGILLICSALTITVAADEPLLRLPTQTVKMKATYAANSWFIMTLSSVPAGFDVINSPPTYVGWCVQVLVNMTLNVNHNVQLYSSYDPSAVPSSPNWDKINYIINNYAGYDRQTIQEVIWYFINDDPLPANNSDAQSLAAAANASGEGFVPIYGQKIAVVANVKDGEYAVQHTFFEVILRDAVPLGDFVWNDLNQNGIQDNGEAGMQAVTVRLLNETNGTVSTTTTNAQGYYSFTGFDEGNYSIQFVLPSQYYRFSSANQGTNDSLDSDADQTTGKTPMITAFTGTNDMSWDAGIYQVQEPGSPGTPGTPTEPPETPNTAPTADGTAGEPYMVLFGEEIVFNGSRSSDHDGTITSWVWNFGDGTTGNGAIVTHNYTNPGKYIVTLTVTDNDGATDSYVTNASVRLPNQPPLAPTLSGPEQGSVLKTYSLRLVTTDSNGDNVRFLIDWGDGTQNVTGFMPSNQNILIPHRWTSWGYFVIQAYAEDDFENASSTISSLTVAVDVLYVGTQGYLIDTDSDEVYDEFFSNSTGIQTAVQRQPTGIYLIDRNGDGESDYQFDQATGSNREYPEALSPTYTMLLVGLAVVVLAVLIIGLIMRLRFKKPKQ